MLIFVYVSWYNVVEVMDVKEMLTVAEIAKRFGVTTTAVRHWLNQGLPYKKEKVTGIKPRMIIDPEDVIIFQNRNI